MLKGLTMENNWRTVPGSDGKYEICIDTPEGMCRSLWCKHGWRKEPYYLSTIPDTRGYIYWCIPVDGTRVTHQAARWIAMTYPELVQNEYFEGAEIDHIDTNTVNNHPSNLRWVDRVGQMNNNLTRIHVSIAQTGKVLSPEIRQKMSESHKGKELSEETKAKISESRKGTHLTEEQKKHLSDKLKGCKGHPVSKKQKEAIIRNNIEEKSKPIMKMDDSGNVIAVYDSLAEAARITGLNKSNISHSALSDRKKCGGFRWAYKEKRAG